MIRLAALLLLLLAALSIPIPWHLNGPFTVEPQQMSQVSVQFGGRLLTPDGLRHKRKTLSADDPVLQLLPDAAEYSQRIRPGDHVPKGQILAILEDPVFEDQLRQLYAEEKMKREQIRVYAALDQDSQEQNAEAELEAILGNIEVKRDQLAKRVLRAPIGGFVVAPPARPEPKLDETNKFKLAHWHGTPLDDRNANCVLEAGEHFCSIAPRKDYELSIFVDQADRGDLQPGDEVEIKFDHLPDVTYVGKVNRISQNGEFFAPEPLTNKYGGSLSTVTDPDGREKLTSTAYRVFVRMDNDKELLKPGMRGVARFLVEERTAWQWFRRYFYETFRFRL